MSDYPDIILITQSAVGISTDTLKSFVNHAPECCVLVRVNNGVNRESGELIQSERLKITRRSTAKWVLIMDDDDELVENVPTCDELDKTGADVCFYDFYKNNQLVNFSKAPAYKLHGFCGIICQRELALDALKYTVESKFLREDVGFFWFLAMYAENPIITNTVLIKKNTDRETENTWLKRSMRREVETTWRGQVAKAQNRIKGR